MQIFMQESRKERLMKLKLYHMKKKTKKTSAFSHLIIKSPYFFTTSFKTEFQKYIGKFLVIQRENIF